MSVVESEVLESSCSQAKKRDGVCENAQYLAAESAVVLAFENTKSRGTTDTPMVCIQQMVSPAPMGPAS